MITREEMEKYLRKGGYNPIYTSVGWVVCWRYKESDMYCEMGMYSALFNETNDTSCVVTRDVKYSEWSIDPNCGCLVQNE